MSHSIDTLRRRAKTLRKAYESGETVARQRLSAQSPRHLPLDSTSDPSSDATRHPSSDLGRGSGEFKHADFLHVIARESGFSSWPDLKLASETIGLDNAQKLKRLKMALSNGHHALTSRLLTDNPTLADGDFAAKVALLDLIAVSAMLAEDAHRATALFDDRRPMMHLAFSRHLQTHPELESDMLAIVELLVKHGADVNESSPVGSDSPHGLSALYGAIAHADNFSLAEWLLIHGADANDAESLYHSTELGHNRSLKLLLAHGADPRGTNALLRAMDFNDHEAVQLLLDSGALPDDHSPGTDGSEPIQIIPALHHAARRQSDARMIALLLDGGADPTLHHEGTSAYAYARVHGNATLARSLEARGVTTTLTPEETLLAKAADGVPTDGEFIDPSRLPACHRNLIHELVPLSDKFGHIQRLVEAGMEYDRSDSQSITPVQVAGWSGLPDMTAYLLSLKPDLSHVNNHGGTLLSAIVHGSEHCPERAMRDHVACARLALEEGVALPARTIDQAGNEEMADFLAEWAESHPGQVVQVG